MTSAVRGSLPLVWLVACVARGDAVPDDSGPGLERVLASTSLLPAGSTWRYWDRGTVPIGWQSPGFDDSAWPSGPAQLGYGDGDEATVVSFGASSGAKLVTTWFRTTFTVEDAAAVSGLTLSLLRDDGAVVYLNGVEVARDNLPSGTITATTRASTAVSGSAEGTFRASSLSPALLVTGPNVLAAEIHQDSPTSSDISFDLSLVAQSEVPSPEGTVRFAVIGDFGRDSGPEADVAALVRGWAPDFVVTTGDNNYPDGEAATIDANIGKHYAQFIGGYQGAYGPGSATNRFWPTLGNNDWDTRSATPYLDYFTLPGNERYYDFVEGPVHFFAIDSDTDEPDGTSASSVQAVWLRDALAQSTSPWNVVVFHHPPYASSSGQTTRMRWPFREWGADLVLSGHVHTYERVVLGDFPYVVNGIGGQSLQSFSTPISGSVVRFNGDYGAMLVEASDEDFTSQLVTRAGGVADTFSLAGDLGPPPSQTAFQDGVSPAPDYGGTVDADLAEGAPNVNTGAAPLCRADGDATAGRDLSCVLRWDVSAIPAGSVVTAAEIVLDVTNGSKQPYQIYPLRRAFAEDQVSWGVAAAGVPWQLPGALGDDDRGPQLASFTPSSGARTVSLGELGAATVQGWVDAPSTNFGVIVANRTSTDGVAFSSSEATTPSRRPRLVVSWEPAP